MDKQEAIKKAYGEYWDKLKDFVDENGWLDSKNYYSKGTNKTLGLIGLTMDILDPYHPKHCYFKRPVSLSGIENNNGWTKIENDTSFPDVDVWACNFNGNKIPFLQHALTPFSSTSTHYQPIEKPKKPIY